MSLAIIVHGGAKPIAVDEAQAHREGCLSAIRAGWKILEQGGPALDAVEAAIRVLEDDPTFNAGYGSELNAQGEVEMDAALMEGHALRAGGIGAVQGVRHPISVARQVLESEATLLVAAGARRFAEGQGAELCDPREMVTNRQRLKWERKQSPEGHDTVGCVAFDQLGTVAAGTSTGGTGQNLPGRIGDSPLIGCGLYADGRLGGCSMTGEGEAISRVVLAKTAVELLRENDDPNQAAQRAIEILAERVKGEGGCILVDGRGRPGWAHNSENMACGYRTTAMEAAIAFIHKEEELQQHGR